MRKLVARPGSMADAAALAFTARGAMAFIAGGALVLASACGSTNHPGGPGGPGGTTDAPAGSTTDAPHGSNPDAPAPSGTDPASMGPYTVSSMDVNIPGSASGRTVPATIYTPNAPGPHALVVISPGFQMARSQYVSYAQHLASWGFVAINCTYADTSFLADHQKLADDVSAVITYALAQQTLAIDSAKIATAGHSEGGDISTLAAADDPRVKAVVGWDAVDGSNPSVVPEKMSSLHAALAVVGETTDGSGGGMPCAPTAENFQQFYIAAASPAYQLTLAGADHMDWVDDGSCLGCIFCAAGTADPSLAHTTTRRVNVAWLRRQLFGDTSMDPWLAAPPEAGTSVARK